VHLQPLRSGANVLFHHLPHVPSAERAALTPGPSPAARERGDLVGGLGIVERRRRRIATSTLTYPPSAPRVGEEGGEGAPGVLCSTGLETVKTLFHHVAETPYVARQRSPKIAYHCRALSTARFLIRLSGLP
jgi:hypothetical protein